MKRWTVPLAAITAVAGAVVLALFLAGVFDGDDASGSDGTGAEVAGLCAEDHPDCEDTRFVTDDEGGDTVAPGCEVGHVGDCDDTPVTDGEDGELIHEGDGPAIQPVCAPGFPDCEDMIVTDVGDEVDGAGPPPAGPFAQADNACSGEALAELQDSCLAAGQGASADLQRRLGVDDVEIAVESIENAEWPDSCLGAAQEGEACATVMTPGFVIVLEAGGEQYEYHTDLNGSVRLAQ